MLRSTPPTITCLALAAILSGCDPAPMSIASEDAYSTATEMSTAGHAERALGALRIALQHDPEAYQRALLDPAFATLRDDDDFRDLMHEAAVRHEISDLTLAPDDEPGAWIEIEGRVVDQHDQPVAGAVVRVFGTDEQGRYHPMMDGESTPRIFGTLVSDADGRFVFRTVRPGPYPGTRNARHVHISARKNELRLAAPQYAVFDDDPLLAEPQNAEQRGEAIRIQMNHDGDPARGTIVLPMR